MRWLAWIVVVACGAAAAPSSPAQQPASAKTPAANVLHAPHGSVIDQVAVTDRGDAALTSDEDGAIRLWPSFDGKREPVVIAAPPSLQLAIARTGDGFLLALLDRAGGIVLQRHSGDGAFIDQVTLPPEPGFDEVRLVGATVLALGRDQRITRYDARGKPTGSIGAPAEEEILAIAVRGSHAVAAIARRGKTHADTVRAIPVTGSLAWGAPVRLPEPVTAISIAPSENRLAAVGVTTGHALLAELAPRLVVRSRGKLEASTKDPFDSPRPNDDPPRTGFIDDNRVAIMPAGTIASFTDNTVGRLPRSGLGVVGDQLVASSDGGSLVIMLRAANERFLGYLHRGAHNLIAPAGKDLAFVTGQHVMQLDDRLNRVRTVPLPNLFQNLVVPIDDRRVVYAATDDAGYRFELIDLETLATAKRNLGKFANNAVPYYDASSRVLAIKDESATYRYALDPAKLGVTPLRALETPTWGTFAILDPKQAGGAIAVTIEPSRSLDTLTLATYYDDGKRVEPIKARTRVTVSGEVLGTDRTGTSYVFDGHDRVTRYWHGKSAGSFQIAVTRATPQLEVDDSGTILALGGRTLTVFERDGKERWRSEVWHAEQVELTGDGKTLVVDTWGGLMALDARTGARVAKACAWEFGLYDQSLPAPGGAPSLCAE